MNPNAILCHVLFYTYLFFLQTQNAQQELQKAMTLVEDQTRTNDDHKRKISEVFEKAEPLKVRIKD